MKDANRERERAIVAFVELDEETLKLIRQANFDLYYGPSGNDDDFPGFVTACRRIAEALSDVGDLYVDEQSECVSDVEPNWCDGCDDEECTGSDPGTWYRYERRDVIRAIVGRELVGYVT
jgi:hypothetical protein